MKMKARIMILATVLMMAFFTVGSIDSSSAKESRTFEGCWTYFSSGQCRAIYRDQNNNYFICGSCDASGNPGGGSCTKISIQTLNRGYWCS